MFLLRVIAVLGRLAVSAFFWLLGLLVVHFAATGKQEFRESKYYKGRQVLVFSNRLVQAIWGNEENGIAGGSGNPPAGWAEWAHVQEHYSTVIYKWSALRNPQNNLRYVPVLSPSYDSKLIKSRVWGDGNFLVTMGVYSSLLLKLKFRDRAFRFWIGWKLKPGDENGMSADDTRLPRADFVLQLKKWKS